MFAFSTMENVYLKSLESQFRFVCSQFCSINSNCALRYRVESVHATLNNIIATFNNIIDSMYVLKMSLYLTCV